MARNEGSFRGSLTINEQKGDVDILVVADLARREKAKSPFRSHSFRSPLHRRIIASCSFLTLQKFIYIYESKKIRNNARKLLLNHEIKHYFKLQEDRGAGRGRRAEKVGAAIMVGGAYLVGETFGQRNLKNSGAGDSSSLQ